MCRCDKPTRNDEQRGWDTELFAPALDEGDALLFDECGRCRPQVNGTGSIDYHSHHLRLVLRHGTFYLLAKHGGGQERIDVGGQHTRLAELLAPMDSDRRYLMLYQLYGVHRSAAHNARVTEMQRWKLAAPEKRIRTRKQRGRDQVKVWIEKE